MSNERSRLVAEVLRRVAKEVELLTDEELLSWAPRSSERPKQKKKSSDRHPSWITEAIQSLQSTESREGAAAALSALKLGRKEIESLSRKLDLPVTKRHSAEELEERIVEATVGFRLRSDAIRKQDKR